MTTLQLQTHIVYGPVRSRRLGKSLGVNLSPIPYKLCPYNCVYCQYGWTRVLSTEAEPYLDDFPRVDELSRALEEFPASLDDLDHITFSGNGEATLHPDFNRAVDLVTDFRDRRAPRARTAILSNAALVDRPEVRHALMRLDRRIMKLDAGDETTWKRLNRAPARITFPALVEGLQALKDYEIQALFLDGPFSNSTPPAVEAWVRLAAELKPLRAQIYTLDRVPADATLLPVSPQRLLEIRDLARAAGLEVEVY
ncbi:MAG: radical SAM protein [Candidatus Zixiibacteriota bacterium]|nr:MAG: radical SAM protein [candidate division Zixibacteria bacterium]